MSVENKTHSCFLPVKAQHVQPLPTVTSDKTRSCGFTIPRALESLLSAVVIMGAEDIASIDQNLK